MDNFDKVLSNIKFPWTVEDLVMVYFIFIIKASIANVYAAYIEVAKDQTRIPTVKEFKKLLLERVFPGYSGAGLEIIKSPPAKRAKITRPHGSKQEIAQKKMDIEEEKHNKRMAMLQKTLEKANNESAYLEECKLFKKKSDEQRAIFKAEEDALVKVIEERVRENAKLKKDLKA